ncbi:MAG TPA: helix-turn-helix domain-containing protein [Candidatus Sulfotelmatobacter sp.]|nr:helix-turn-helix domain-containing protein [Candidatus Sulfotelmatobacter sp.]
MRGLIDLSFKERSALDGLLTQHIASRQFQRALALVLLDDGESIEEVSEHLLVSRRTVYNWVDRFKHRCELSPTERLLDGARSGRPATAQGIIEPFIEEVIDCDPREYGYNSTVWTAPLLGHYLHDVHQQSVSLRSIGAALARLRIHWKLPRHVLSRRAPFWRQAKGGSKTGSGAMSARWCSCSMRR